LGALKESGACTEDGKGKYQPPRSHLPKDGFQIAGGGVVITGQGKVCPMLLRHYCASFRGFEGTK